MQLVPKMSWIERLCTVYNLGWMLNRGSTEDFLMLTLQLHLFSKFPFGALTSKHGRQTKLVCLKKKKPSDNGFFYVTVAAYFDKQGEIDRSSRLAIKNR